MDTRIDCNLPNCSDHLYGCQEFRKLRRISQWFYACFFIAILSWALSVIVTKDVDRIVAMLGVVVPSAIGIVVILVLYASMALSSSQVAWKSLLFIFERNKMSEWKFNLGERAMISPSESGVIIGRAQFVSSQNSYLVRYVAGDGRLCEIWWGEDALELNERDL
jgi:energy-converting hydrogenase Eha subunit E